jgi:hypothetical protein
MTKQLKMQNIGGDIKTINFDYFGGVDNFLALSSGGGGYNRGMLLRRVLPWLAKANNMTANAIADLPFDILKENGDVYDSSADWKDNLGGIPNPKRLIRQIASSLCFGKAYVIPTVLAGGLADMHYCATQTVSPMITTQGLQCFFRTSDYGESGRYVPAGMSTETVPKSFPDGKYKNLDTGAWQKMTGGPTTGEMLYFWLPDSDIEIGPAKCYPMSTAALSADLLVNMDATLKTYSERGFVPATILAAHGMPKEGEREKAESWWNKFLRGWTDSVSKIINAESMDVKQVGAGFEALRTVYRDLTRQQIENIGASHGIPGALFMSDMAFASEFNAMIKFWYNTSEFISIYHTIEETFNEQLLNRFKLRMQFKPETLDAFQEDENQRAAAYRMYISTDMRPSIAAEMLGLDLPENVEYANLDEKYDKPQVDKPVAPLTDPALPPIENPVHANPFGGKTATVTPMPEYAVTQSVQVVELDAQQIKDLDLWRQVAVRNYGKGKGKAEDFKCESVPAYITDPIRERLAQADNELDVLKAFDVNAAQSDRVLNTLERAIKLVMDE